MIFIIIFGIAFFVILLMFLYFLKQQKEVREKEELIKGSPVSQSKKSPSDSKKISVEDFLYFKHISEGLIFHPDGTYCALIEVAPINYAMLSTDDQIAVDANLATFYRSLDYSIQELSICRSLNLADYYQWNRDECNKAVEELIQAQKQEQAESILSYMEIYLRTLDQEIRNVRVPERKYVYIIRADETNKELAKDIIYDRFRTMSTLLGGRFNIRILSSAEAADVFFTANNKRRSGDARIKNIDYFSPYIDGEYDLVAEEERRMEYANNL